MLLHTAWHDHFGLSLFHSTWHDMFILVYHYFTPHSMTLSFCFITISLHPARHDHFGLSLFHSTQHDMIILVYHYFSPHGMTWSFWFITISVHMAGHDRFQFVTISVNIAWHDYFGLSLLQSTRHDTIIRICHFFSPHGHYFASGSQDRTGRLWSVDHYQPLRFFVGHLSDVDVSSSDRCFLLLLFVVVVALSLA